MGSYKSVMNNISIEELKHFLKHRTSKEDINNMDSETICLAFWTCYTKIIELEGGC